MPRMAIALSTVIFALLSTNKAQAQDQLRWRTDYAAARKEAAATGKPLLLDFGTEACTWCRKLEATTFRDRAVVEAINARCIPVKVDGERESRLTGALGVQAFPTIVLASAEGKVLARHEGYADSAKLMALLRQLPGTEERKPVAGPQQSESAVLFTSAKADHDAGRYLQCIQKCDKLIATPEAVDARRLSATIVADPEKWKRVTMQLEADLTAVKRDLDSALKK